MNNSKKPTPKKLPKLTFGLGILVAVLLILQIVLSNRLATEGKALEQLEKEIEVFNGENQHLKAVRAEKASLSGLANRAASAGFVSNPPVLVFPQDQAVAFKP